MSTTLPDGVYALPHWGLIRAQGPEAAQFLNSQLTQDFALLGPDAARLAALCSPKGRMLASFIGVRPATDLVLLACSADLLAPMLKRLQMFKMRAKLELTDASAQFTLYGLAGGALAAKGVLEAAPWCCQAIGDAHAVSLYPADGVPRALWMAPAEAPAPHGPVLETALWQWGEVRSGVAAISAPVTDAFVPQMLNYESVGGVNFKKGCYPGQEVVARSQFRGTQKRRGYVLHGDGGPLAAGQEVFADDPEQPVGTVAQAAPAPGGGWAALASLQVAAAGGALHAGAVGGPLLRPGPLPYPLLEDI